MKISFDTTNVFRGIGLGCLALSPVLFIMANKAFKENPVLSILVLVYVTVYLIVIMPYIGRAIDAEINNIGRAIDAEINKGSEEE